MKYPLIAALAGLLVSTSIASAQIIPPDPSGLQLWLDAGQNVTHSGGAVSSWGSRVATPSYQAGQTDATKRPQWIDGGSPSGQPTLRFDGANDRLQLDSRMTGITTSFTAFAVVSLATLDGRQTIFDSKNGAGGSAGYYLMYRDDISANPAFQIRIIDPADASPYRGVDLVIDEGANEFMIVMARVESGPSSHSITLRVGDAEKTVSSATFGLTDITGVHALSIGGTSSVASGNFLNGDLSSLLFYNRALSDTEAAAVTSYLHSYYVIPEPSTAALLLAAPALLLLVRRFRSA